MDIKHESDDMQIQRNDEKYSQRKSKKPLMEKRRRQRINNCLMQLKTLVLQAMKKDTSHYSKLEKADILEMTVKHLRMLQRRQISSAVAADPTVASKYNMGFSECASEVMRYLSSVQGVNEDIRNRVVGHLDNCMQTATVMIPHNVQPIHVQIPANQSEATSHGLYSSDRLLVQTTPRQPATLQNHMLTGGMHVSGAFELVPGNGYNGPVALYLGHSNEAQNIFSVPVSQGQMQQLSTSVNNSVQKPLDNISCKSEVSPICQSMNGHCGHYNGQKVIGQSSSPVFSPAMSALKEERVWRPW